MAKAVQCDVCKETKTKDTARRWQVLRLSSWPVVEGWGKTISGDETDASVDVCSETCAKEWFSSLLDKRRMFL